MRFANIIRLNVDGERVVVGCVGALLPTEIARQPGRSIAVRRAFSRNQAVCEPLAANLLSQFFHDELFVEEKGAKGRFGFLVGI